jgi:hypothetical protein
VLEAHDVFVPNAHEHIVPVPEDRPAILLLDIGGLNLVLVVELVTVEVDAVGVHVDLFPSVRNESRRVDRHAGLLHDAPSRRPRAGPCRLPGLRLTSATSGSARSLLHAPVCTISGRATDHLRVWVQWRVLAAWSGLSSPLQSPTADPEAVALGRSTRDSEDLSLCPSRWRRRSATVRASPPCTLNTREARKAHPLRSDKRPCPCSTGGDATARIAPGTRQRRRPAADHAGGPPAVCYDGTRRSRMDGEGEFLS